MRINAAQVSGWLLGTLSNAGLNGLAEVYLCPTLVVEIGNDRQEEVSMSTQYRPQSTGGHFVDDSSHLEDATSVTGT